MTSKDCGNYHSMMKAVTNVQLQLDPSEDTDLREWFLGWYRVVIIKRENHERNYAGYELICRCNMTLSLRNKHYDNDNQSLQQEKKKNNVRLNKLLAFCISLRITMVSMGVAAAWHSILLNHLRMASIHLLILFSLLLKSIVMWYDFLCRTLGWVIPWLLCNVYVVCHCC